MADSKINIRALFDLKGFSTSSQNLQRQMKQAARQMQQIGSQMSMAFTAPVLGLGALAVKSAADFESLKTSLTTSLGGSAEAAKAAFKEIENFAASTPFAMSEVTNAFIKLKNMGLDPSMEALTSYGNTASSMGKSLNDMVEAVADAAVGEFERLKEFGIKASSEGDRVKFTFKGVTTEVGKNSEEIQKYLLNIGNTEFAGGIEAQSKTFNGVISTLKDNMAMAAASFGDLMLPALSKLAAALQGLAGWIRNLNPTVKKMIMAFTGVLAVAGPILVFVGMLTAAMASLATATGIATAPILAVILALAALAAAFVYVRDNLGAFEDFFHNVWTKIKNTFIDTVKFMLMGYKMFADLLGLDIGKNTFKFLDGLKGKVIENRREFGSFGDTVDNVVDGVKDKLSGMAETAETVATKVSNSTSKMAKAFKMNLADVSHSLRSVGSVSFEIDFNKSFEKIEVPLAKAREKALHVFEQIGTEISEALNNGLQSLAAQGAVLMGQFLGDMMSGGDMTIQDFGKGILSAIGNFMTDFGQAMIAIGIAQAGINAAIASMNPVLAIGAGIALVAAGAALSNIASKGIDTNGGSTGGYNSPSGSMGGNRLDLQPIVLETRIQGRELILVQDRSRQFRR